MQQQDDQQIEVGLQEMETALKLYQQIGARTSQANIYVSLAQWLVQRGRVKEALSFAQQAYAIGSELAPDHPVTQAIGQFVKQLQNTAAQQD